MRVRENVARSIFQSLLLEELERSSLLDESDDSPSDDDESNGVVVLCMCIGDGVRSPSIAALGVSSLAMLANAAAADDSVDIVALRS